MMGKQIKRRHGQGAQGGLLGTLTVAIWLSGCSGEGATNTVVVITPPEEPVVGLLSPVIDAESLEESIKSGFNISSSLPAAVYSEDAVGASALGSYTGTYTQEKNVDEFDAVRYDGSHLYIAPRRYQDCCFIFEDAPNDGATNTGNDPESSIRILETDPQSEIASLKATIPLEENVSVQGLYINNSQLFALTSEAIYGMYGDMWADIAIWGPESMGYRVYDVSDPANPVLDVEVEIEGVFVDSRRIDNTVYIVSRYTPNIDGLIYYVTSEEEQAANEQLLASVTLQELLPKITVNGQIQDLVTPGDCYITTQADDTGYSVITSITAISMDDPSSFETTCYNEEAYGIYVSNSALYLTEPRQDPNSSLDVTRIHKFGLSGSSVDYRGSAEVGGVVWRGGQADFRMSEHESDLRVFTSLFDWESDDSIDHELYILRESDDGPVLDILSTLPNDQYPDEIGKPDEALYGVRFLGDRAYAVTFLQIDPLYAFDLSDPSDPFVAGELEITGFSDFLHPVSNDLLLGLGSDAIGGIKLELFDVSNLAQPLSLGSISLGGQGSYSEARFDRHAFTYQPDVNGVDRFAIPAHLYSLDNTYEYLESGLYLFDIRDKEVPELASLNSVGSILPPTSSSLFFFSDRNRSFIHQDTVYYIRNEDVWVANWNSPTVVNGPF